MKTKPICLVFALCFFSLSRAQSPVMLDTTMFDAMYQSIFLPALNGWIYHKGNDIRWAAKTIDTSQWRLYSPFLLSVKDADENGRAEGWFRLQFILDSSFKNLPLALHLYRWVAMDVYLDGSYLASVGNTGINGRPYKESISFEHYPLTTLTPKPGEVHVIAIHFVDSVSPLKPSKLKSQLDGFFSVSLLGPQAMKKGLALNREMDVYFTIYTSACLVLAFLFWLLFAQNRSDKELFLIALGISFVAAQMVCVSVHSTAREISFLLWSVSVYGAGLFAGLGTAMNMQIMMQVFKRKASTVYKIFTALISGYVLVANYFSFPRLLSLIIPLIVVSFYGYVVLSSWKKIKGAQWSVVAGFICVFVFSATTAYQSMKYPGMWPFPFCYVLLGGVFLSLPLSLTIYVSMRFKEILSDVRENARQVVQLSEEKKQQALNQQKLLEEEVARQTKELQTTLTNLRATQAQLVQQEKMASLGELTAGIAHEIQNPLNFVNNFSEVSKELTEEAKEDMLLGKTTDAVATLDEVIGNLEKVAHHGRRADRIVKSMMEHARNAGGEKQATDINQLTEEYLKLAYHGFRTKDSSFSAVLETHYDPAAGELVLHPQEIGRVLLNLFNNAFYALEEKKKYATKDFVPTVSVSTTQEDSVALITVKDNGTGIAEKIKEKIYQPFFTTKPTGEGTGLGLSLSYDIITKGHSGELRVESKEGEGATFTIRLPIASVGAKTAP